jgi:hypothetical protein
MPQIPSVTAAFNICSAAFTPASHHDLKDRKNQVHKR